MSDFTDKIKNLRLKSKLTQSEIANIIGCTQGHYLKIENDKVAPTVPVLTALADYYKVSTDYLLGRSDYPYPAIDENIKGLRNMADTSDKALELVQVMINDLTMVTNSEAFREALEQAKKEKQLEK